MYICGHPGTGKTSILKKIIKQLDLEIAKEKKDDLEEERLVQFFFNGMPIKNLFHFGKLLMLKIRETFQNDKKKSLDEIGWKIDTFDLQRLGDKI